ncbi:MAG: tRNA preQ1(34) S-adenosylmethionine ribosyltransferase-isomerase QueA [Nitrospirae bacterium RBG_13_39_12]|nr:MAG: tRNA preQ1(34) S-adenosylmethionine ribosyltransferase-isomerase QueA [Nitrospirae bacterium RBG_13_39_12]
MKVADFDFSLPKTLIAKRPLKERSSSRLLVLHRDGTIEHKLFSDLPSYLNKGDLLLMNNTKVFPARLTGIKQNGGNIEILMVRKNPDNSWEVFTKGKFNGTLKISDNMLLELYNGKKAVFKYSGDFMDIIWEKGNMPLPPYIRRLPDESDKERYQTVFAKKEGSIAAPTAGLHFTDRLLKVIKSKGTILRELTLHVGVGTFRPIRTENIEEHYMDLEYFELDKDLISEIKKIKVSDNRVFSVGTTTTRAIEGYISGRCNVTSRNGKLSGITDAFIYPGYKFRIVDSLITNFHLPRSTPLMLTSAICSWEKLKTAYTEAVARRYRFLSYGDAMLIL